MSTKNTNIKTKAGKAKSFTFIMFLLIALGSMYFVTWIAKLAYENTSIDLQEQHIESEISAMVELIENSIRFGKELDNYYGMEEELENICAVREGELSSVVFDTEGNVLYSSADFKADESNITILNEIYATKYQNKLKEISADDNGTIVEMNSRSSMIFPIASNEEISGYLIVIYNQNSLKSETTNNRLYLVMFIVWLVVSVVLGAFIFTQDMSSGKWHVKYLPTIIMMVGMLAYSGYVYSSYQNDYRKMTWDNAEVMAQSIRDSINSLIQKGLPAEDASMVGNYINSKVETNSSIASIYIVKGYYDTSEYIESNNESIISFPLYQDSGTINIVVDESFISKLISDMRLTLGVIFIICLMITYELSHLAEIVTARVDNDFGKETPEQVKGISAQIKLISFLAYTAIYTSMPYATVIMREWKATVFGFSESVSASLPLTVELLCIMVFSVIIQKIFAKARVKHLMLFVFPFLILGNIACMRVDSPYMLIGLRAFCGIGFAFLKYWMNTYVGVASSNAKEVSANFALLNAGLLGGITSGASLGSLLANSFGYQYNYFFTAEICLAVMVFCLFFIPWKMIEQRRETHMTAASEQKQPNFIGLMKQPAVLKTIIFGDVPLNIGLMYVVAFLPVYMSSVGQSSIITSYAYLLNGLAGVYIGVVMIRALKNLSPKAASSLSLLIGAGGILILVGGNHAGIILASAAVMGLFDGYGTPTITGFFTSLPEVANADTASMLTVFSSVGSAVQIICPILYNVLIQPDGQTTYLLIFGIIFAAVGVIFPWLFNSSPVKNTNKAECTDTSETMKLERSQRVKKIGLTQKFIFGFVVAAILLVGSTVLLNSSEYSNSISTQYQENAYQIADSVADWLDADTLQEYKNISQSGDQKAINDIINSEEYKNLWNRINALRKSMQLNDIYIVYYTPEEMHAYAGDKSTWQPLHYLFDCLSVEDEAFALGDSSSMNPDNLELFAEVPATGKIQEKQIISQGDFGYNISALRPVLDESGNTVAVIGVELPMRTLQSRVRSFVVRTVVSIVVTVFLVMLVFVYYQYKSIIAPIKLISEETRAFGKNGDKVSEKLKSMKKTGDEMQILSDSIIDMEDGIIKYVANIEKITAEKERIGAELNVATQIQADMLPRIFPAFPERKEFDIYASMDPAKEVGGDFYDFFMIDDDHLALVMADVSGKGVPAALFMVIAKTLIKNRAQNIKDMSPAKILADVNNQLCEGNEAELFVTVWMGILEISTGKVVEANAGHEHPALRRHDGKWELSIYKHAPALAVMEGMRFKEREFQMKPGDSLYVYTDGVAEATNANNELYGSDRMVSALNQVPDANPKEILANVRADVDTFVGEAPQFDDLTMLCLKYYGLDNNAD